MPSSLSGCVSATLTSVRCEHRGLTKDDKYKYSVKATNAMGDSKWSRLSSETRVIAAAPNAPNAPTATSVNGVNTITWEAPEANGSAITGYTVEYDKQTSGSFSGTWAEACTGGASDTSCEHTGLTKDDVYKYRVKATNVVDDSDWSGNSTDTTVQATAPSTPATPTVASASGVNTITWVVPAANGSAITGYTVEYDKQTSGSFSGSWTSACTGGASDTSCQHTGLTRNDVYKYRVKATNSVGDSSWSSDSTNTTVAASPPVAPATPSVASAGGVNIVTWSAPANNGTSITGYTVQSAKKSGANWGSWLQACTGGASDTTCQHTGLTRDEVYKYRVSARNIEGASSWSSESNETTVSASVPSAPATPEVASLSGVNTITWVAPADNGSAIDDYTVQSAKKTGANTWGSWTVEATTDVSNMSWQHTGLTKDDVYKYQVRATNSVGYGSWSSDSAETTVSASAPSAFAAAPTAASSNGVNTITWVAPAANGSSITGYTVEYDKQTSGSFSGSWAQACTGGASDTSCQHTRAHKG